MLLEIKNMSLMEATIFLLSFENALSYDKARYLLKYPMPEETALGYYLCGGENFHIATSFIEGGDVKEFFENVCHNSVASVPYILRCINLRCIR